MKLFNDLNRALHGKGPSRPAPKSHWEIHWEDGEVGQVRKVGRDWSWWYRGDALDGSGAKNFSGRHYSSHLDGIRDHLKYNLENNMISGWLVKVPN
jgi:hypothetical protein